MKDPSVLFMKSKRNIKFHFDLMHLDGNLNKALDLRKDITKDIVRPFVKLPSVNQDRIELLIETLKKQNLLYS